jgi:prepilin-type N-terminal cleavage/methylation domain-containing protein
MKNRRNSGFTLVEVIITMGLIGILALVSAQMYLNQVRQQRATSIRNNLDQLRTTVQNIARDPDAIRISAEKMVPIGPGGMQSGALEHPETPLRFAQVGGAVPMTRANPMLYACVNHSGMNDPARDCREVTATQPAMPVRLFTRTGVEVNGAYSPDGVRCGPTTSALCPFKVTAKLYPKCPDNPALTTADHRCSRAQKVQIAWSLEQVQYGSGAVVPGFAPIKKITAEIENSASGIYAVPVSTQNIVATENLQVDCPKMTLTAAMLRAQGAPTPAGTPDGLLDRKYLPLVGMEFPQQVNQVDTYGQQVCGPDIGALDAELLKREVCKLWITQAWNGTITNNIVQATSATCNVKVIKKFKLAGSPTNTTVDCAGKPNFISFVNDQGQAANPWSYRGGEVQDLYGRVYTPQEVQDLITQYGLEPANGDNQLFCRFHGGSCPAPLSQHLQWSVTQNNSCSISFDRGNAVNDNAWSACRDSAMVLNKCGHGNPAQSGSHGWENKIPESKSYNSLLRVCYGGHCGDHVCYDNDIGNTYLDCSFSGGGSQALTCYASIAEIGCH